MFYSSAANILNVAVIVILTPLSFFVVAQQMSTSTSGTANRCEPIHSRAWGMTLVCCGPSAPLPEDCKYKTDHLCAFSACTCSLTVDVDSVHCADNVPVAVWKDHDTSDRGQSPFACRNPNFPNSGDSGAEFSVVLNFNAKSLRNEFYLGLSRYKITELEISFRSMDELPEAMFTYFPTLKRLKIYQNDNNNNDPRMQPRRRLFSVFSSQGIGGISFDSINLPASVANIRHLEMLTIQNITRSSLLYLPDSALFADRLRYLHVSNCGLRRLPDFLRLSSRLEYLKITRTNLTDVQLVGRYLPALKLCFLSHNKIQDLTEVSFENSHLRDLDLSYNQITTLSLETFAGLTSLTFLDLSNNRLKRLPAGVFYNLRELKWLYLHHDFSPTKLDSSVRQDTSWKLPRGNNVGGSVMSLDVLGSQHFVGLSNLEYLSLANNPNVRFEPGAFEALENLLSLDLKHCNLSQLPEALADLCRLKYLWLNFNSLGRDTSFPPQTFVHLVQHLDELDINENSVDENARAFFLIAPNRVTLVESLLFALKQQSVWWNDRCAPYHWWLHLVESDSVNATMKTYYQQKFAFTSNRTLSTKDKLLCNASYAKIVRDSKPYKKLVETSSCYKLAQERSVNHQLRRQLVQLSRSFNKAAAVGDYSKVPPSSLSNNNNYQQQDPGVDPSMVNSNNSSDAECQAKNKLNGTTSNEGGQNCQHLYDNVNLLGYLLAVNFAVLLIVCLCCVVTFCKRQSSSSSYAPANVWRD